MCLKGKIAKLPFTRTSNRSTKLLEIIHTVCGPMRTQSNRGAKYFVMFMYDYNRCCEIKFLESKSEVINAFKEYKSMAEKQTEKRIKFVQSGNGTEYRNREFERTPRYGSSELYQCSGNRERPWKFKDRSAI